MTTPDTTHAPLDTPEPRRYAPGLAGLRDVAVLVELVERLGKPVPRTRFLPVWEAMEIPPRWHSCSRMARSGRAKLIPRPLPADRGRTTVLSTVVGDEWTRQVCPCGADRVMRLVAGRWQPAGSWCDRNAARRDPNFWTRRSAYPNGAPPHTLFI